MRQDSTKNCQLGGYMKIAYVRSYTSTDYHNAKASSDAIGYGRTCSLVLERELGKLRSTELITVATPDDVSLGLRHGTCVKSHS